MAAHNDLGRWGEELAAQYLCGKGYRILHRDWKLKHRDLDIVAMSPEGVLAVVEVKTRRNDSFYEPEEAVTYSKMKSVTTAANAYIKMNRINADVRFDIIAVTGTPETGAKINHITDAFMPML